MGQWYRDILLYHYTLEDLKFNTRQTPYMEHILDTSFQSDVKSRNMWQAGIQTYILHIEHSMNIKIHMSFM